LAAELERLHKSRLLKIYPPVGLALDDGHNMLYENIPVWESDVFEFLDQYENHHALKIMNVLYGILMIWNIHLMLKHLGL
jgi:hypothetical protein